MSPPPELPSRKTLRFAISGALLMGASGCGQEQHIRTNEPTGPVEPPELTTMNEPEPIVTMDDLGPNEAPPPPGEETPHEPAPE